MLVFKQKINDVIIIAKWHRSTGNEYNIISIVQWDRGSVHSLLASAGRPLSIPWAELAESRTESREEVEWAWQWGRREHRPPLARTPASTPQLVVAAVELAAEMVAPVAAVAGCSTTLEEWHWRWPDSLETAVGSQALRLRLPSRNIQR